MKKRSLAIVLTMAMCVTSMAGCGGKTEPTTPAPTTAPSTPTAALDPAAGINQDEKEIESVPVAESAIDSLIAATTDTVKLTVWASDVQEAQDYTQELIDAFKAEYPTVNFDITLGAESESTAKDTVLTDITAAADVYSFADDQITELVKAGALQPVSVGYTYDVSAVNAAGAVNAATVDGQLYAYPMTADNTYYLFYDKSVFSEEDVASLDTMVEKAKEFGKKIGFEFGNAWYLYGWFAGAGLNAYLGSDGANVCNWNESAGVDVAQAIMDYCTEGTVVNITDDGSAVTGVKEGTYAAVVNGIWNSPSLQEEWGDNFGAAKLPEFTAGGQSYQMNSYFSCKLVGVNPHSENVGWAMVLAEYLTSENAQKGRFEKVGWGPSNTNVASSPEVQASADIAAISQQTQFAQPQRIGDKFWDPAATLGKNLSEGTVTDIQAMLDEAVTGITAQ